MGHAAGAASHVDAQPPATAGSFSNPRSLSKVTKSFDAVFQAQGARIMRTPIQVPESNGIAERFVRTVRSECLDWLLIVSALNLERALTVFVDHYNGHRAHRDLELAPPNGRPTIQRWPGTQPILVKRRDRLGGLIHDYNRAA